MLMVKWVMTSEESADVELVVRAVANRRPSMGDTSNCIVCWYCTAASEWMPSELYSSIEGETEEQSDARMLRMDAWENHERDALKHDATCAYMAATRLLKK